MTDAPNNEDRRVDDSRPPVFGRWRGWYIFILAVLLVQIVLYSLITLSFS